MKLDHDVFHVNQIWQTFNTLLGKSSEDQKKSSPKIEQFLSPNLREEQKRKKKGLHRKLKTICPRNHVKIAKDLNIILRLVADYSPNIGGMQM